MTKIAYLPNGLNEFDTYTYNISLYMISPDRVADLEKNISQGPSVLIVDNARNAKYNISDLEQIFVVGNNQVRTAMGNKFTMTISEPNGVTLLETIRRAAQTLGMVNHLRAVYLIRIEFNGRTSDGKSKKFPQVFYYPVTFIQFQFKIDGGGTMYHITAIENSTNAYSYLNNAVKNQITIEAQTVGEFLQLYSKEANQSAQDAVAFSTDAIYPDKFSFELDSTINNWGQWQFQALTEPQQQGGVNIISSGAGGAIKLQITIPNGSNLTDIIGMVLAQTAEYKNILIDVSGSKTMRTTPDSEVNTSLESLPIFHKIITNVKYDEYDILRGEYVKNITYKVVPYTVSDEIISAVSYTTGITNKKIQADRVQNIIKSGLLRKQYNYIFTGLNTEVLELDIKFDREYYYITPFGGGRFGDPDVLTPQAQQDRDNVLARFQPVNDIKEKISLLNKKRASLASIKLPAADSDRDKIGGSLVVLDRLIQQSNTSLKSEIVILTESILSDNSLTPDNIALTMRFARDVLADEDYFTSDNDKKGGSLIYAAVKANLENSADMLSIELGIRGDPYWMGKPNSFYTSNLRNDDTVADFERGTQNFFLKINLPVSDEDANGRRKPRVDYDLTGLYTVRNVICRYQNGQFTQYLGSVRDLGTNTSVVLETLENAVSVNRENDGAIFRTRSEDIAQAAENALNKIKATRGFNPGA
jgi:hypothetical protein